MNTFEEKISYPDEIDASAGTGSKSPASNLKAPAPKNSVVTGTKPPKPKPPKAKPVPTKPTPPAKPVKPVVVPPKPAKPIPSKPVPVPPQPARPANASSLPPVSLPEKPARRSQLESFESLINIASGALSAAVSIRDLANGGRTTQVADGAVVDHEAGTVTLREGQEVNVDNKTVIHADGSKEEANGDITYPDGRKYIAAQKVMCHVDGSFEYEDGTLADKDGNYIGMRSEK